MWGIFSDVINDGDVIGKRIDFDGGQQSRSVQLIEDDQILLISGCREQMVLYWTRTRRTVSYYNKNVA